MSYHDELAARPSAPYDNAFEVLPKVTMAFSRTTEKMWELKYKVKAVIDGKEFFFHSIKGFHNVLNSQDKHGKIVESYIINPKYHEGN